MSYRLVVHGGAGAMRSMSDAAERAYREGLRTSADTGHRLLKDGATAREVVVAAVRAMETSTAFDAGRGSALSDAGRIEADAAVMDGSGLRRAPSPRCRMLQRGAMQMLFLTSGTLFIGWPKLRIGREPKASISSNIQFLQQDGCPGRNASVTDPLRARASVWSP